MMADFDIRQMMDRYVYDYLIKRHMHKPAEIFKNETNLDVDLEVPPAIDVPEGFLLEWWTMNYEFKFFREWLSQNVKPILESTQEQNALQSEQFLMNTQTNKQWLVNSASAMSPGSQSMALHGSGAAPQVFSLSSYQEGMLATALGICTPTNYANSIGHKSEPFTTIEAANTASVEEPDPWLEHLVSSFWIFEQDGLLSKIALGENIGSFPQALMADDDNTSETSDCTSRFPRLSTAAESFNSPSIGFQ